MIDLYPLDRKDRIIMDAVMMLHSKGYHVVRPERQK